MLAALSHDRHSPLTAMRLRIEILEETEDSIRLKALIRRHALNRALRNLIDNAVRFGDAAEVTVTQEPGFAVITVAGKGPGLPEDQLEAVFEPFVRLEACRSRDTGGGVGLGLAIARTIVQAHSGTIQLPNRIGGGPNAIIRPPVGGARSDGLCRQPAQIPQHQ